MKFLEKKYIIHFLLLITFIIHLYSLNNNYYSNPDTFEYMVTAKSISSLKYNRLQSENESFESLILPVFPFFLSIFYCFNLPDMFLMRCFIVLLAFITTYLIYFLFRKIGNFDQIESGIITFIVSLSPMYNIYSRTILTDILYLLLVMVLLLIVNHKYKNEKIQLLNIFITLTVAMLTRPTAVVLFPALIFYSLLNKKFKFIWPAVFSFIFSFIFLLLIKNDYFFGGAFSKIYQFGAAENNITGFNVLNLLQAKISVFIQNIYEYVLYYLPSNIFPINFFIKNISCLLMNIISLLLLLPVIFGFYRRFRLKKFVDIYFLIHFLFFMFIYKATGNGRHMLPILPVYIYYFYIGIKYFLNKINLKYKIIPIKFKLSLIMFATMIFIFSIGMAYANHNKKQPDDWNDLVEIANYIKSNVPVQSKIFTNSRKKREIYLISNKPFTSVIPKTSNEYSVYFLKEKNKKFEERINSDLKFKTKNGYYEFYQIIY